MHDTSAIRSGDPDLGRPSADFSWVEGFTGADEIHYRAAAALVRAEAIATQKIDALLKAHGLTFARYEVLLLLSWSRRGRIALKTAGEQLMVHQAAVTSTVDRLEADGLVRREPHPRDGRVTLAQITNAGRLAAATATTTIAERLNLGVDADAADEIFALVQKFRRAADDVH